MAMCSNRAPHGPSIPGAPKACYSSALPCLGLAEGPFTLVRPNFKDPLFAQLKDTCSASLGAGNVNLKKIESLTASDY